jgi:hypothetical protein
VGGEGVNGYIYVCRHDTMTGLMDGWEYVLLSPFILSCVYLLTYNCGIRFARCRCRCRCSMKQDMLVESSCSRSPIYNTIQYNTIHTYHSTSRKTQDFTKLEKRFEGNKLVQRRVSSYRCLSSCRRSSTMDIYLPGCACR